MSSLNATLDFGSNNPEIGLTVKNVSAIIGDGSLNVLAEAPGSAGDEKTRIALTENQENGSTVRLEHSGKYDGGQFNAISEKTEAGFSVSVGNPDSGVRVESQFNRTTGEIDVVINGTPKLRVGATGDITDIG